MGAQPFVGLSTVRAQRFGNENLLGFYTPQEGDTFGAPLATGDFNRDGVDDLATGLPGDDGVAGSEIVDSGSVVVRYGIAGEGLAPGLAGAVLRQTAYPDPADEDDGFGSALAACDINGDGFDDLAVGIPWEDHLGREDAGAIQVHFGGPAGLSLAGEQFTTQSSDGVAGSVEQHDEFGFSLACGDFNGDRFDDVAVGVPFETFEQFPLFRVHEGMVVILPGSASGLNPTASGWALKVLHQDVSGIPGEPEAGDLFGWGVGAGDFNDDGFADLAVGVPGEDESVGYVHVVFGSAEGLRTQGTLFFDQSELGGTATGPGGFGLELASADFDGDDIADLAIGAPGPPFGPAAGDGGSAMVLFGGPDGFDLSATQFWDEDTIWGPGTTEHGDCFGFGLAAGDFDKDGFADLAFANPCQDVTGPNDGVVSVIMGSALRLTAARRRLIAAGLDGFPGELQEQGELFGSMASGDFDADGHADLAVGSPLHDEAGLVDVGAEAVLYGAVFADGLESGNTAIWTETVGTPGGNRVRAFSGAALGPKTSRFGLQVTLFDPSRGIPSTPAYVHVGSEAGFRDETTLKGSFFVDPQGVQMSAVPGANSALFEMITFTDGPGRGKRTQLAFNLNRDDAVGGWVILATYFNENVGGLQFASGTVLGAINDPAGNHYRIEFEWKAGTSASSPGRLSVWKTRFIDRAPDAQGRVFAGAVDLPGTTRTVINDVFVGMISGQDAGTSGTLLIDELSFRR